MYIYIYTHIPYDYAISKILEKISTNDQMYFYLAKTMELAQLNDVHTIYKNYASTLTILIMKVVPVWNQNYVTTDVTTLLVIYIMHHDFISYLNLIY